jgi:hypothetical protein
VSTRSQQALLWWGIGFTALYVFALAVLIGVVPPQPPSWSAQRVAEYYSEHQGRILVGAVLTAFSGAFMIPLAVVAAFQSARLEPGRPVWSVFMAVGGTFTSIFLIIPTLCFGVAAYRPDRSPDVTALMHDSAYLSLFSTVQFYIFFGVAIAVACLRGEDAADSPFPRLFGYFTIWCTLMFEIGGVCFLAKHGPFGWNGLFIFWIPFFFFFTWLSMFCFLLHRALGVQRSREVASAVEEPRIPVGVA